MTERSMLSQQRQQGQRTQLALTLVESGMSISGAAKKAGINRVTLQRALRRKEVQEGKPQCPCCLNRVERLMLPDQYVQQIWAARRKLYPEEFLDE